MTQALQDVIEDIKSLEPLPQVAMRVFSLAGSGDLVPRDLVEVIQTDAGITAKVLKLCNSAYYGFRREIASLHEAGNLLGCQTLVNLVLTSCTGRYFRNYGKGDATRTEKLWERSVASALACSLIASKVPGVNRQRAYTIGLLQNVGLLVMERFLPERRGEILAKVRSGGTRLEAEQAAVGIHHADIGAMLAERWSFPVLLVESIRCHHAPSQALANPVLAAVAHLGDLGTQHLDPDAGQDGAGYPLDPAAFGACRIVPTTVETMQAALEVELGKAKKLVELM